LVKYANIALERIYKPGYHYKKAGVIVFDFTPEDATQCVWSAARDSE
jgi:hypothetical protein